MIFKNARLKLTFWYVLIIMIISTIFSVLVYQISFREIRIINVNQSNILRRIPSRPMQQDFSFDEFEKFREQQFAQLKQRLIINLIFTNLIIFVLAGLASYVFAKRTLKPIEDVLDLQNRFTADASHELRTPLAAIKIENEVALRDKRITLTETKKVIKSNLEEINNLTGLISSLLDLSQYQLETNSDNFKLISTKEVINKAIEDMMPIAEKKGIQIRKNLINADIKADENQIARLVTILLDNAIKYSQPKNKIEVKSFADKESFCLTVKDNGIGIRQSDIPFIFDRFYRADQSRSKEKYHGYGLGLSIAKKIIYFYKGSIAVESLEKEGTTFKIKIPLSDSL